MFGRLQTLNLITLALVLLSTSGQGQLSQACFHSFQFEGKEIELGERYSGNYVSDLAILDELMLPQMRLSNYKFSYEIKGNKGVVTGLQLFLEGDNSAQQLTLKKHGIQTGTYQEDPYEEKIPSRIKTVTVVYGGNDLIKNVIFVPVNGPAKQIMPEDKFYSASGDYTVETSIQSGYELVGFNSLVQPQVQAMEKLDFVFVNRKDVRCQVPSQALVRNITALFLVSDEDEDGYLRARDVEAAMDKLNRSGPSPESLLNIQDFQSYIMANGLKQDGILDLTGLITIPVQTVTETKIVERVTEVVTVVTDEDQMISDGFAVALVFILVILLLVLGPLTVWLIKLKRREVSSNKDRATDSNSRDANTNQQSQQKTVDGERTTQGTGELELYKLQRGTMDPPKTAAGVEAQVEIQFESDERFEHSDHPSDRPVTEEESNGWKLPLPTIKSKGIDHKTKQPGHGSKQVNLALLNTEGTTPGGPSEQFFSDRTGTTSLHENLGKPKAPDTKQLLYNNARKIKQMRSIRSPRGKYESDSSLEEF